MNAYLSNYHSKKRVRIVKTVEEETGHGIWDEATRHGRKNAFSATQIRYLVNKALERFQKLSNGIVIDDDHTKLADVRTMYKCIWKDSSNTTKIQRWAKFKKKSVSDGPPQGSDEIILATTANLINNGNTIELVTFDHDFIIFSENIKNTFCVDVMDASTIILN